MQLRIDQLKEERRLRLDEETRLRREVFDGDNNFVEVAKTPKQRKEARELKAQQARKKAIQVYPVVKLPYRGLGTQHNVFLSKRTTESRIYCNVISCINGNNYLYLMSSYLVIYLIIICIHK